MSAAAAVGLVRWGAREGVGVRRFGGRMPWRGIAGCEGGSSPGLGGRCRGRSGAYPGNAGGGWGHFYGRGGIPGHGRGSGGYCLGQGAFPGSARVWGALPGWGSSVWVRGLFLGTAQGWGHYPIRGTLSGSRSSFLDSTRVGGAHCPVWGALSGRRGVVIPGHCLGSGYYLG